jgi:cytochrome P450
VPFEPLGDAYLNDPYPVLADLRSQSPVFYSEELRAWVVLRHGDVEGIFRDHDTFSAANAQDPVFPLHPEAAAVFDASWKPMKTMSNADGETHARIRKHNQHVGFSTRRLRALEPVVRVTAERLVSALCSEDPSGLRAHDLVAALAFPLPAETIFRLLGFDPEDTALLQSYAVDRLSFSWGRPAAEEQARAAELMVAYRRYCDLHTQRRLRDPKDDFTSDLLEVHRSDPDALTLDEISHIVFGLSFAGHETTTNLIANTLRNVLADRPLWASLCADPAAIPSVVDEVLRLDSSVIAWRRVTTRATQVAGVEIGPGETVLVMLAAANRDPEVFAEPDRLMPGRGASRHLSFGFGKHYCLGATLAKIEVSTLLEVLAARVPDLRLVADQALRFHPNVSFRGPRTLLATW